MARYTPEQLEERYKRLPPVLQEALFSPDVAQKLFEIGKKNGLTIEKVGFAAEEAGFVILGLTRPREFSAALAGRLEVDGDTAKKIALDISHEIFFPLREALKQTHQVDVGETELQKEPIKPVKQAAPIGPARPTPRPSQPKFLTKEEVEKLVAEKKAAAAPPPTPPPKSPAPLPPTPTRPTPPPPAAAPQPSAKIPPIDLRRQMPAALSPPPKPQTAPVPPPIPSTPSPQPVPPAPKIPPIDLRSVPQPQPEQPNPQPEKTKPPPWRGLDPYREPVE